MILKGQKISDRYQIIKSIGEGGMANVYLAYDTILDRNVAVKVLRGDLASDEKFVRRFQREALSASSLTHQNIVEVYDVGEDNGTYYIVMEYVEGTHLKTLIKKRGKLSITETVDIMKQIADGMSVAHDSYIIHRDIKPQNIMILDTGLIKITDFGIATALNATQLTQTNSVMGSVHYLPPEQASGKGATLQSDIYSMGILMYELLTGTLPYKGENAVEIALKHLKESLPSIKNELPNIPQSIENIILKSTAKNPKNRYKDAREMLSDLETVQNEERLNEPKYVYKYPEIDYDETRILKTIKKEDNSNKELSSGDIIAKQITGEEMKKQNKLLIILGSIFTSLVVLITSLVIVIPLITEKTQIIVPDVTNKTVKEAVSILQQEGFIVSDKQIEQSNSEIKEGNVIKTNPVVGSKRKKNAEVTLYVSIGDTKITIEDYTGENYLEIKGKLEALGLYVLIEKEDTDNKKLDEGTIMKQSIEKDTKLSVGDTITLYIPNITNKYPNFTNGTYTVSDVQDFAKEHNLTVNVTYEETNEYSPGTIIYQSKPEGYLITANTSFTIKVASKVNEVEDTCEDGLC